MGEHFCLGLWKLFRFVISSMGVRRRRRRQRRAWVLCGPIGLGECDWGCWSTRRDGKRRNRRPRPTPEAQPGHWQHTRTSCRCETTNATEEKGRSDTEKPSGCMEAYRSVSLCHRTWRPFSGRGRPAPDVHLRSNHGRGRGRDGDGTIFSLVPWPGLGGW